MKEEENTINVRGETPPAPHPGASKLETLARLKWHLLRSTGHGGPLALAFCDDGSKRDFKLEEAEEEEGRLCVFGPVLPNFPRKKLISDFLQIFWHRRTKAIGGENHNAN